MTATPGAWARALARLRTDLWDRPPGNFPELDGLRGFASVIVVVYHCAAFSGAFTPEAVASGRLAGVRGVVNGFWSGIDIFFVLSGFLIGRILLTDLERSRSVRWPRFMTRRVFRIFPAYYLVLTLSLFVIAPWNPGLFPFLYLTGEWDVLLRGSWANYLYVSNYVHPGDEPSILSWGWSLCVEEHFYLLLPPLLFALYKIPARGARLALLGACALAPLAARAWQFRRDPSLDLLDGFYYFSHNRFDEIFVGVLIAYGYVVHRAALESGVRRLGPVVPVLGLLCVAGVWVLGGLHERGVFAVVAQFTVMAAGSGLLVLNGLFLRNPVARFFAHPAWYPLARISYGTYLVHPFVLFALLSLYGAGTRPVGSVAFVGLAAATFALATLLAGAMFVAFERPLLDRGAVISRRMDAATEARG